jgi:hypothetical protein
VQFVLAAVEDGDEVLHVKTSVDYRGGSLVRIADEVSKYIGL